MREEIEKTQVLSNNPASQIGPRVSSIPEPTIYAGTMMENMGKEAPGSNRPVARRKLSTFNLMLLLAGTAVAIVLYISNVIKVSQLLTEINILEGQHKRILMDQELLRAQINRMSSMERIRKLGEENLGLRNPTEPPVWMKVDEEKIHALETAAQHRRPRK